MSAAPIALGVLSATVGLSVTVVSGASALAQRVEVQAAADLTALAAADALFGFTAGEPCASATRVSEVNRVHLIRCEVSDTWVRVEVQRSIVGLSVKSQSRAGLVL